MEQVGYIDVSDKFGDESVGDILAILVIRYLFISVSVSKIEKMSSA